ncbi:hypothetical protein DMENIID0001_160350 [Sergentomyia squamirostris]
MGKRNEKFSEPDSKVWVAEREAFCAISRLNMTMPQKASKASNTAMTSTNAVGSIVPHPRRKVRDFNSLITCQVCQGYIIEATTIADCMHTFCRSCIIKHLDGSNLCPTCSHRPITVANLRPDRILKTLIYKLVPGLYQCESQRVAEFHGGKMMSSRRRFSGLVGIPSPEGKTNIDDDINHNISKKGELPEQADDADFFYPEEPISLSMEYHPLVVLSMKTQKSTIPPIRYLQCPAAVTMWHLQRFIATKFDLNPSTMSVDIIYEDEVLPRDFSLMDVAYCYNWKRVAPMRFYYRIFMQTPEKSGTTDKNRNYMTKADEKRDMKLVKMEKKIEDVKKGKVVASGGIMKTFLTTTPTSAKPRDEFEFVDETPIKKENTLYNSIQRRGSSSTASVPLRDTLPNVRIEKMKLEDGVKTVKLTMFSPKSEVKPKFKIEPPQVNDFKRLRSNDSEFGDIKPSGIVPDPKTKVRNSHSSVKPSSKEDAKQKKTAETHKRRTHDDDSPDELSCSKSSMKKCYINRNKKGGEIENGKPLPTVKVDLTTLKTKITIPKVEKSPPVERPSTPVADPIPNKYEYAKNIGLVPIADVLEAKRQKAEGVAAPVKEKKRKKMKHSKEPSEKRPKLHAEMISNEKEPIKLKLKFTNKKTNGIDEIPKIQVQKSSKDTVAEMRKVRHKSHSTVNPALNRALSEQSAAISSIVRRMSVDLPQTSFSLPASPQVRSPPLTSSQNSGIIPKSPPLQTTVESTAQASKVSQNSRPSMPQETKQNNVQKQVNFQTTATNIIQTPSPSPRPSPPQTPKPPSPKQNNQLTPKVSTPQPIQKPTPKTYPGLMSPKAADRGNNRFQFPITPSAFNARPASFPPYPMTMQRPLSLPKTSTMTSASSTKPLVSVLKRSASVDGCPVNNKQPRLEDNTVKYHPMPPLNRTISSPATTAPKLSSTGDKVPYYSSPLSSTYTHENKNGKKSLPLLLPPSSISVTKMGDVPNSITSQIDDRRPAVEIVRINSTTPAVDQQQQQQKSQKATRPPPATIPLVKIKKTAGQFTSVTTSTTTTNNTVTINNNNKVPPLNITNKSMPNKEGPVCDSTGALDLSGKSSRSPSLEKSPTSLTPPEKIPLKKDSDSKDAKVSIANKPCPLPMPKLNEISKVRPPVTTATLLRQQNPSVRTIPNPCALAFRNQVMPTVSKCETSKSQPTSTAVSIGSTADKTKTSDSTVVAKTVSGAKVLSTKLEASAEGVVSTKKNTIEQVAATLRAAAGDTSTQITKLN